MSMISTTIRLCFRGISLVAPSLAGWGAFKLFIRPMSRPKKLNQQMQARIDATLAQAESKLVETSAGPVMLHHWRAEGSHFKPEPRVLLLHGWTSRSDYMLNYVPLLLAQGISCYAMDFPAHGRSPGKTVQYWQAVAAIQEVQWQIGPLLAQIGHSFGGAMSMMATRTPDGKPCQSAPRHMVLVAAPASLAAPAQFASQKLGLSSKARKYFQQYLAAADDRDFEDLSCASLQQFWSGQLTIVHDQADTEVLYQNALEIKDAYPTAELITTQGLGHRRILRDPDITKQIVQRITSISLAKCA